MMHPWNVFGWASHDWLPHGGCSWSIGGRSSSCEITSSTVPYRNQTISYGIGGEGAADWRRGTGWRTEFYSLRRSLKVASCPVLEIDRMGLDGSGMWFWASSSDLSESKALQPTVEGDGCDNSSARTMVVLARWRCGCWASCNFLLRLAGGWAWVLLLGPRSFALHCFCFLIFSYLLFSIISHQLVVGFSGLNLSWSVHYECFIWPSEVVCRC